MAKRVSTDEKLEKILKFFHSTADIFNKADLEKKLSKECGINSMLIPDLLKNLQDNNMIECEKCGIINVYYSFPKSKHHFLTCEIEKAQAMIESYEEEIAKKDKHIQKLKETHINSGNLDELCKEYAILKEKTDKIDEIRKNLEEYPIDEYQRMAKETEDLKAEANKYTDNIYTLQSFVCNKFSMAKKDFNGNFNIDEGMDYL